MNILKLTLKKEWFDLIKSGEKIEEYRELKEYWFSRLTLENFYNILTSAQLFGFELFKPRFKKFDYIQFTNGYSKNSPRLLVELNGVDISTGKEEWGAASGVKYFVFKLGKIIKIN